ncbi:MAG: HopJ type III effector protein [Pedobacter sp.]|nr:MAG: HopJ type III effector protein [Pedobacter sp.]
MKAQIQELLAGLKSASIQFAEVIDFIEKHYLHQPTAFKNGEAVNESSQNQGSAKVFGFAKINELDQDDTLLLFAEHYITVKQNPNGTDHQNIRQFMANGWSGIVFDGEPLTEK